jgi:hypothetical protein
VLDLPEPVRPRLRPPRARRNADRDATVAKCRVNTASGTKTVARVAAALRNAGRRLTILPMVADSRTNARTLGLRNFTNLTVRER